jgi:hypothetical protein
MSKQALLTLKNFNLFKVAPAGDGKQVIEFSIRKGQKVPANFSSYDKEKGWDVRGIRIKGDAAAGKKGYIRLSVSVTENGKREFYNAALFGAEKKGQKSPDLTGSLTLTDVKDGEKLRLAAWKKSGPNAGEYLSISVSEYQPKEDPTPIAEVPPEPSKTQAASPRGFDDMDDDIPF